MTGVSLLAVAGLASACSDVPDAVNPVSWYHGVEGWFEDDEAPPPEVKSAAAAETAKTPGTEKSFPSVNEVPEKPATTSTVEERRQMMANLSADKANAQYIEESQTQSETVNVADSGGGSQTETATASESTETEMAAAPAPVAGEAAAPDLKPAASDERPPPLTPEKPILDPPA